MLHTGIYTGIPWYMGLQPNRCANHPISSNATNMWKIWENHRSKLGRDAEVHRILVGPRLLVAARIEAAGAARPGGCREPTQVLPCLDATIFMGDIN